MERGKEISHVYKMCSFWKCICQPSYISVLIRSLGECLYVSDISHAWCLDFSFEVTAHVKYPCLSVFSLCSVKSGKENNEEIHISWDFWLRCFLCQEVLICFPGYAFQADVPRRFVQADIQALAHVEFWYLMQRGCQQPPKNWILKIMEKEWMFCLSLPPLLKARVGRVQLPFVERYSWNTSEGVRLS